ncbi:MAG: ABC transporter ATP-binding protein [Solirubrobacterales bacterium]|nr:ABC transporter ATP-binding protein [Solirubrobacterales bacterium]
MELSAVERRYGERVALAGATVSLPAGHTLAVLGPNGAGKTTLLRILATLLRPHGGRARVLGHDLPDEAWQVRGSVGYLGHDPLLYRELTGRENLVYHARLHGLIGRRRRPDEGSSRSGPQNSSSEVDGGLARVEERLAAVGMDRRADGPVRELSKGMVQRLAVARATLHDPDLLLLDEPRANLDPAAAEALEPLIGRASGRTRVLVTHDVEGGLAEADLALGLRGGRQAFCRPAADVDPDEARGLYR